ncbi:MAG: DUF4339 domain-containing protein [Pirellulaceae bacterium]|nr:DUF4339 domain-containing protein [Pirellulaceae bacterium]
MQWYVRCSDLEQGPLNSKALKMMVADGLVTSDWEIRAAESQRWQPIKNVKGLVFAAKALPELSDSEQLVDLRRCPYCDELIRSAASKCKHCGEKLESMNSQNEPTTPPPLPPSAMPLQLATLAEHTTSEETRIRNERTTIVILTPIFFVVFIVLSVIFLETIQGAIENGLGKGGPVKTHPFTYPFSFFVASALCAFIVRATWLGKLRFPQAKNQTFPAAVQPKHVSESSKTACKYCGNSIAPNAQKCGHCGEWIVQTSHSDSLAAVLGVLFGPVGLWYKGHWAAGFAWIMFMLIVYLSIGDFVLLLSPLFWIGMGVHAALVPGTRPARN